MSKRVTGALVGALLLFMGSGLPAQAASSGSARPTDYRFGVVEASANPAAAESLHVGWTRVPFFWANMEPQPGVINVH